MARAAVRAKQAQAAQAQAAVKPSRKQRKHASGGNPNQDLFFSRLRRRQKWVYVALIVIFAVSFVFIGVGSGSGGGLDQLYQGIFGGGGDAVAKAQSEIKTNPEKGYKDLANAYVTKNDLPSAVAAMKSYLALKQGKKDSNAWAQLGGYEKQQGDTAASQYQQVLQVAQLQSPGSIFQPPGTTGAQFGENPIEQSYMQKNQGLSGPLYQKAIAAYNASLTDFQNAAKYASPANRADAMLGVYSAAQVIGNKPVALHALQRYVQLAPNSPNLKDLEAQCKRLGGSCTPKSK